MIVTSVYDANAVAHACRRGEAPRLQEELRPLLDNMSRDYLAAEAIENLFTNPASAECLKPESDL